MTRVTVGDVMTAEVVTAREETSFKELARLMLEHRVSGVPVVDAEGVLIGIVTEADLMVVEGDEPAPRNAFLDWFISPRRLAEMERRTEGLTARDVMTPDVVSARPDMTVREAARLMLDRGVKRLPIVDAERRVVGIASRRDVLTPYLRSDEQLREEISTEIVQRIMWLDPAQIHVEVTEGVVTLRGQLPRRSERDILVELARQVDGVLDVKDQLSYADDDRRLRPGPSWAAPLPGGLKV